MDYQASSLLSKTQWTSHRSKRFRKRKLGNQKSFITPLLLVPVLFSLFYFFSTQNAQAHHILTEVLDVTLQPTATPQAHPLLPFTVSTRETPAPITVEPARDPREEIRSYITEVFGEDQDKAFRLLECENPTLDPDAVNTAGNYPEGSRDIGVFQINEYWQQTQGKFLFNWKINVLIAKQLYDENGKSFILWTCGKSLNI